MQAKCPNFVLCSRELSTKVERKFAALPAIIRWNKGRYFVEFSVPHRKFPIISDILLADRQNFAWNRTVVCQRSCKVLHASDTISRSCNLHEIYFDNCLKLRAVIYHVRSVCSINQYKQSFISDVLFLIFNFNFNFINLLINY